MSDTFPEPLPGTLGDYLPQADLIALPFGADCHLGIEAWPQPVAEVFRRMNVDEQHSYVFQAAWWAATNGDDVGTILLASLRMLAEG